MAIPCDTRQLENEKFVECPAGSGKVASRVKICNPEDISVSVPEGKTLAAGETISAVKAIYSNGVALFLGDANTDYQHASIVGISITGGNTADEIRYLIDGPLYDSSFSFTDGEPVFLALNGGLTQTDPMTLGYTYRVLIGYATGTNGININIQEPIEL